MKSAAALSLVLALLLTLVPAVSAAPSSPIYLGFTSDVHGSITTNLKSWLSGAKSFIGSGATLEHMIFGGDYTGTSGATNCRTEVNNAFPGTPVVLVRGNHESSWDDMFAKGQVYNGNDYAIYALDSSSGTFSTADITALGNWLTNTIKGVKPVFVVAHHPIHTHPQRTTGNAAAMLTELNKHQNVIYLWGHNHTVGDSYYGEVFTKGQTINGHSTPIQFTYLSYGAMGQGNNNAYGLIAKLSASGSDTKIEFSYLNTAGAKQSGGSVTIAGSGSNTSSVDGWQRVSAPVAGETYLVVGKLNNNYYALTADKSGDYLKGTPVTVSGNQVTSGVTANMKWDFVSASSGKFNVKNGSNFIIRKSQGGTGYDLSSSKPSSNPADYCD